MMLPTISDDVLEVLMRSRAPIKVVDARFGKWDDGRRIPGAISVSIESSGGQIEKQLGPMDTLIVTYCGSLECPASDKLAHHLINMGFRNVLEFPGGLAEWEAAGKEIVHL
jgi:rhodanese-related sulfurtransferase